MSEKAIEQNEAGHRPLAEIIASRSGKEIVLQAARRVNFMRKLGFESDNRLILIKQIRNGVTVTALDTLAESLSLPIQAVSNYVDISARTLSRRKQTGLLNAEETERVFRVGSLIVRAEEVLSNHEEAMHWLKTPKKALGGQIPLELADTEVGADEVKDLLGRIEHGVFA